jgi:outer membrane receptor protein involved in Fe transport
VYHTATSPTPARPAAHSQIRLPFYFGTANNRFQIPNNPSQHPQFVYGDISDFNSADLNENQREVTRFGLFSLQGYASGVDTDYRIAIGQCYTSVNFDPDVIGDLMFNGVASMVGRTNRADTPQADLSTPFGGSHLLRYGLYASGERAASGNDSLVFPADAEGAQTSKAPFPIVDDHRKFAHTMGLYLQDQWQVADNLVVNYGLRADHYDAYVNESQVSPRVGVVWNATASTTVHAGYARYFTPPDTELIAPTDIALYAGTTNHLPNDQTGDVKAERSNYYDVRRVAKDQRTPDTGVGWLLPAGELSAGRGPVRRGAGVLAVQLRARPRARCRILRELRQRSPERVLQPGAEPRGRQGHHLRAVQLRRGRTRIHRHPLGTPRP